jgi:lipopolysaccharide export system protein LptC
VSAASLRAQTPDAPAGGKKAEAEESDDTANMTAMMIPGQDVKGMRYAHRNENDEVVMEFESEVARKLDDENIEMENLKIVAFDEEGKRADILLPRSVFNVTTRILTGKDQVVIKRDDVEIIGETGEFNTKTRFAKLLGNVKMIILNTENLDKKNTEKTDQ